MKRFIPYRNLALALVLVLLSVFLMNITGKSQGSVSYWENLFARMSRPFVTLYSKCKETASAVSAAFSSKSVLLEENERLKEELSTLDALRTQISELQQENERLKNLLEFKQSAPGEYKAAKVILRDSEKWFSSLTISIGEKDGVKKDAAVISRQGLVGRVISVSQDYSQVLVITDPESGVGAVVSRSREQGVVMGGHGADVLVLRFFSKDADVNPGDQVVTSSMGGKYPEGIPIGEVTEVYIPKPGLVKECYVRPFTDLNHLEEVMVKIQ